MPSFLADTCRAAIDALAEYVGRDAAEMIVFCKMRPKMLADRRDPKSRLHVSIVDEMNPLFRGFVNRLNCDYEESMEAAMEDGTYDEGWTPPASRAPHWNPKLSVQGHNQAMADLRDQIRADWKKEHKQQDISPAHLKMYMAGMAAHAAATTGDVENFNGEP